jgi:hypothetical protein
VLCTDKGDPALLILVALIYPPSIIFLCIVNHVGKIRPLIKTRAGRGLSRVEQRARSQGGLCYRTR